MINFKVDLGEKSYPIFIGDGILDKLGEMLKLYGFSQAILVTDTNVQKLYGQEIESGLKNFVDTFETIVLLPGESSKGLKSLDEIITKMLEIGLEREAGVLAFGGGIIGDVAGFAASVYKRGVPHIQIPTTLLAQVDASIGGKTGVNHILGKNMIGTFHQPKLVWCDLRLLKTLPKREIICGLGEIVKYGVINDESLFDFVEENLEQIFATDLALLETIVQRCARMKAEIVAKDEFDRGLRMVLNFGHTIGHVLEATLNYKKISHGQAVLLGMLAESKMALDANILSQESFSRIENLVHRINPEVPNGNLETTALLRFMQVDKKIRGGKLSFVLPKRIGEVVVTRDVDEKSIISAINYLITPNRFKSK